MKDLGYGDLAARQHGLVTRRQLLDRGTRRQVERLIATKRIATVRRGVFAVVGSRPSWEQCLLAACLAAGSTARASLRSAGALWDLQGFAPDVLEITVAPTRRARLDGVIVHESNLAGHETTRHGIPVTSVARTLADLSRLYPEWRLGRVVDDAIRRKLTTMSAYERVARDLSARGRRRSTVTRHVLEARSFEHDGSESDGERRIADVLVRAGLPRPAAQHHVRLENRTVRLDLAYPSGMLAIEYDGWTYHRVRTSFDRDRERDAELQALGWRVARFTSDSSDSYVVATVRRLLARPPVG